MKTGTACTRCENSAICPAYDDRMLYGFCQGFVDAGEYIKDVAILDDDEPLFEDSDVNAGALYASASFLKIEGKMESDKPFMKNVIEAIRTMQHAVHKNAVDHGWWESERSDGELIALQHAELSECLEALRDGNQESEKLPGFCCAEEELADVVIRIMDHCEARGWRLGAAIVAKHEFNKGRPYKHGGKEF